MENITLPRNIGLIVWLELEKKGVQRRNDPITGLLSFDFSQEELDSIEKLHLSDLISGSLKGISNLRNLKSLSIDRVKINIKGHRLQSGIYIPQDRYTLSREIPSISNNDIGEIAKLENLESLRIVGQSQITWLDVSRLTKLKDLNVSGNMKLESIDGLENLQQLDWLTMIGNHELTEVDGLNKCLNNPNMKTVALDPQLFPKAVNFDIRTGMEDTKLIEKMSSGDIDAQFFETFTSIDDIKTNLAQMLLVHNRAKKIIKFFNGIHPSSKERIMLTQAYLGDVVRYDHESKKNNHTHTQDGVVQGPSHGANSLFNCLYLNSCVCEGYSRGAKYLLGLQGIHSREVSCIAEKDSGDFSNDEKNKYSLKLNLPEDGYHSILLVENPDTNEWGYCDPCWNATCYQKIGQMPFMLMGNEEIKQTHTLSLEEQNISIPSNSYRREMIARATAYAIQKYQHRKREVLNNMANKNQQTNSRPTEEPER